MARLEKLLMRIELLDKVTAPANKIMGTMNKLTTGVAEGFANIAGGAVGMWGVGAALTSLTDDYHDFHRAAGEVRSLSVADDAMKHLQKSALAFSIRYGESAADFVRSSYDIQSAIAGLVGTELATFTEASNVLAKGTKADAATITNYMGTMYGIFKNQADAMGKAQWVQQLTGQTAQAVEMFKTNGVQMSGAFTALGADATAHGVAINEQMAVLGKLQATMSGSEAGTKYKAFLRGVGNAQEELGMKFTDSAGRMLPVDQILSKLQGKFGAIDTVAESDLLKKAFGSDEAVAAIKLLIADTQGLTDSITTLGNVRGMEKARAMAEAMTMKTDQLNQAGIAVKIGFGALVDKALIPFYDAGIKNLSVLSEWIDKYPHLFGALAKLAIWIGVVVAAVSAFAIIKGAAMIAVVGFTTALTILKSPLYVIRAGIWLWNAALAASRILLLTTAIRFPMLITGLIAMKAGFISGAASAWAFTAALLANPITWVVVGVVALIAALAYVVTHWDSVKAAAVGAITWMFEKWQAFRAIIEDNPVLKFIFQPLLLAADFVGFLINNLEKIPQWFAQFKNWLSDLKLFDVLMAPARLALETLNLLPGVNIDTSKLQSSTASEQAAARVPQSVSQYTDNVLKTPEQQKVVNSTAQTPALIGVAQPAPVEIPASLKMAEPAPMDVPVVANLVPPTPVDIPASLKVTEPAPVQVPAVVNVATPTQMEIPASLKMAEPAPMNVPVVANVAPPALVEIPASIAVAEPANMPFVAQAPGAVKTPKVVERADTLEQKNTQERDALTPPPTAPVRSVPPGGLQQQFNNSNSSRSTNIQKIEVNTTQLVSGYTLADQLRMAGA